MAHSSSIPLHLPRPARVRTAAVADQRSANRSAGRSAGGSAGRSAGGSAGGAPIEVDGRLVAQVRESWLIEDRWWTEQPLRRRYWEVVTACGRNVVVFRDLERASASGWFVQR
jgi:hypothetical protein